MLERRYEALVIWTLTYQEPATGLSMCASVCKSMSSCGLSDDVVYLRVEGVGQLLLAGVLGL